MASASWPRWDQHADFMWPKLSGGFGSKINIGPIADLRAKVLPGDGTIHATVCPEAQAWLVPMEASPIPGSSFEGLPVVAGGDGGDTGLMALWQKCVHLDAVSRSALRLKALSARAMAPSTTSTVNTTVARLLVTSTVLPSPIDDQGNLVVDTGTVLETPRAKNKTIAYPQGPSCL